MNILYHHRTRSTDAQRIHILEIVKAFEQLGHKVEIVSLVPTDAEQNNARRDAGEAGWKKFVRRIPFGYEAVQLAYNLVGIPLLLARMIGSKVDFLYERYSLFNFTGVVCARLCRVPLILEVNSPFALEQSRDRDIRSPRFAQWTERLICNLATRVIVVSTPLARIMESSGVPAAMIEVMPNGVSPDHFQPAGSSDLRASLGIGAADAVIGFVGWFRKWHGLEMLLEAFHRSGVARRGVKVLLIGDGPAMADLSAYVREQKLERDVLFSGPLPHAEVPRYLATIDIAVQPAANEYCCPMKILEYMALAKPIVAPRQENIEELLDEEAAEFFTPGDAASLAAALASLSGDRARAQAMGRHARQLLFSRGYLWTANAERVVEMVREHGAERRAAPYLAAGR